MELSFNFRKIDLKGLKLNVKAILCVFLSVLMVFSSFAVTPVAFESNAATVTGGNVSGGDVSSYYYAESAHPYENNTDQSWYFSSYNATSISITFSSGTYTEPGYDYIYIYDGWDNEIGRYSGNGLSGSTLTINGNAVTIRLISDSSVRAYGFAVTDVVYNYSTVTGGNISGGDIPEQNYAKRGDVDRDGEITAFDARLTLRASVGLETLSNENFTLADVDMDGKISASDARLIIRASVGLERLTEQSTGVSVIPPKAALPYNDFLTLDSEVQGDKLIVTVNASDLFYLKSGNFELNYDSSHLAFSEIVHDPLNNKDMLSGYIMYAENTDEAGKIRFAYAFMETAGVTYEAPHAIVTVTFDILSDTSTNLSLSGKMFIEDERYTLQNDLTVYTGDSPVEEMTAELRLLENSKDTVKVQLTVNNAAALTNFDLVFDYDSSVLSYNRYSRGEELQKLAFSGAFMDAINPTQAGEIRLAGSFLESFGINAETVIYIFEFNKKTSDATTITMSGKFFDELTIPATCTDETTTQPEETPTEPEETTKPEEITGHTHSFSREVIIEPGCDTIGEQEFTCSCGEIYRGIIPATGHSDDDSNGICDNCEEYLDEGNNGNSQSFLSSFFARIVSFFERIFEFLKNLFNF